jgi:hypothetical protein
LWSPLTESNRRPSPYHGDALPTELRGQVFSCLTWGFTPPGGHPGRAQRSYNVDLTQRQRPSHPPRALESLPHPCGRGVSPWRRRTSPRARSAPTPTMWPLLASFLTARGYATAVRSISREHACVVAHLVERTVPASAATRYRSLAAALQVAERRGRDRGLVHDQDAAPRWAGLRAVSIR